MAVSPFHPSNTKDEIHIEEIDNYDQNWKRFKFETAVADIIFTSEAPGVKTKMNTKLVIKGHGSEEDRRIVETQEITMINKTVTSNKHTIMEKEWLTTIDLDKGTGVKIKNMSKDLMGSMTDDKAALFGKGDHERDESNNN